MSNSYKKEPYHSCGAGNFKSWKRAVNGILRSRSKIRINVCLDWEELIMPKINECGEYWTSPKDGRSARHDKPALNQCEIDLHNYRMWGMTHISWYKTNVDGHKINCNCYDNKAKSWYWKMMRK